MFRAIAQCHNFETLTAPPAWPWPTPSSPCSEMKVRHVLSHSLPNHFAMETSQMQQAAPRLLSVPLIENRPGCPGLSTTLTSSFPDPSHLETANLLDRNVTSNVQSTGSCAVKIVPRQAGMRAWGDGNKMRWEGSGHALYCRLQ